MTGEESGGIEHVLRDEAGPLYVPATAEQPVAIARALFGEWEATHGDALTLGRRRRSWRSNRRPPRRP